MILDRQQLAEWGRGVLRPALRQVADCGRRVGGKLVVLGSGLRDRGQLVHRELLEIISGDRDVARRDGVRVASREPGVQLGDHRRVGRVVANLVTRHRVEGGGSKAHRHPGKLEVAEDPECLDHARALWRGRHELHGRMEDAPLADVDVGRGPGVAVELVQGQEPPVRGRGGRHLEQRGAVSLPELGLDRYERVQPDHARVGRGEIEQGSRAEPRQDAGHQDRRAHGEQDDAAGAGGGSEARSVREASRRPQRSPLPDPADPVREDDGERGPEQQDRVGRARTVCQHAVREPDEGDGRQNREQRAPGTDGERMGRERGRPYRGDRCEHQRRERRRRRDLDPRLTADLPHRT